MLEMYREILNSKASRHINDVLHGLNAWEGQPEEYYRCGGGRLGERTRLLTAHSMIPRDTNPIIKLAIKKAQTYEEFKRELRTTLNFLDSFRAARTPGVHVVGDQASSDQEQLAPGPEAIEEDDEATATEVAAMVATMQKLGGGGDYVLAAARAIQRRNAQRAPAKRVSTCPRDPKDTKCANCNQTGHTAATCTKPKRAMADRLCHVCNKPGRLARRCPDRDKQKPAMVGTEQAPQLAIADKPYVVCMVDEEGYTTVSHKKPKPRGVQLGELPMQSRGASQKERRANRFAPLACLDENVASGPIASGLCSISTRQVQGPTAGCNRKTKHDYIQQARPKRTTSRAEPDN